MKQINKIKEIQSYLKDAKVLDDFRKKATTEKIPIIDDSVGWFLEALCFLKKPGSILEIGCGCGYSTFFLMKGSGTASYTGIDLNKDRLNYAKKIIEDLFPQKKCTFLHGNAIDIIPKLENLYDFVFIDAAKYEYLKYIELLTSKLLKDAVVVADNIFYKGKIFSEKQSTHDYKSIMGIKEFISFITKNNFFESIFINIGDGISVSNFLGIKYEN